MRRIDLITQACDPKTLTVGQLMQKKSRQRCARHP